MNKLLDFIFPPRCILCGESQGLLGQTPLCTDCYADLHVNQLACSRCAIPLQEKGLRADVSHICGECLLSPPVFDVCWSPFIYAQPLEWMIQQLKFNAKLIYAPLLASLMMRHLPEALTDNNVPDAIIPMPLHRQRLKQRGFNQSQLLAQPLARHLGLKIDVNSCQREHATEHQTGKTARQRKQNIKGAFSFNNHQQYRHLVIFDDVVTTGSSVAELSRVLKLAGVNRVDVWCLARAEKVK